MSNWEKVVEDGQEFWVNEDHGNVYKQGEKYIVLFPKVISFGQFDSLEHAKKVLESQNVRVALSKELDILNEKLTSEKLDL